MSNFNFNKVVIIESLEPDDFKSGTELCQYINGIRDDHPDAPSADMTVVEGCDGFLAKINELTIAAQNDIDFPILHIEMHGWNDKTGLAFPDGSSLTWSDLANALASLNKATRFNLVVCISACFGGHFVEGINPMAEGPCFAMVGPTHTVDGAELLGSFRGFYRELLTTLETPAALEALRSHRLEKGGFITISAEDWFFRLAKGHLLEHCTSARLEERLEGIMEQITREGRTVSSEQRLQLAKEGLKLAKSFLNRMFPRFFMINAIPENMDRFGNSLAIANIDALNFFNENYSEAAILPAEE